MEPTGLKIEELDQRTFSIWSKLRQELWEHHTDEKDRMDFARYQRRNSEGKAMSFLAVSETGQYVGFLDSELRSDYVEGAASSPVWYIEGIFVVPSAQGKGVGRLLVQTIEDHARSQGYSEIASDCELDDTESEAFHRAVGFREVIRSIHLVKRIS
jgi:aminoglycoside 6'-N-acetyltransferase I